jgi:hypothetical protein
MARLNTERKNIGWREWLEFPELGIRFIKAKVDTGARTSAIHAFELERYSEDGVPMVRFGLHPVQKSNDVKLFCTARVTDERVVADSGGHREKRVVITTPVRLGDQEWPIELTLTNRDTMRFRVLLGRTALSKRFLVEADASFLLGRPDGGAYDQFIKDLT